MADAVINIEAIKGDTIDIVLTIKNQDGSVYEPEDGDVISFQMKENYNSTMIFYKTIVSHETFEVVIPPSVTEKIRAPKKYVFDADITLGDGRKYTFLRGTIMFKEKVEGKWKGR